MVLKSTGLRPGLPEEVKDLAVVLGFAGEDGGTEEKGITITKRIKARRYWWKISREVRHKSRRLAQSGGK